MRADFRICIDSCVMANIAVCDVFLRLAKRPRMILPFWTSEILDEVYRTHTQKLNWKETIASSFQKQLEIAFPESWIEDYQALIPSMQNDEKDRHVLAAAVKGQCPLIITFNLKDFTPETTTPWGVTAVHPQDYLETLYDMDNKRVIACLGEIAGRRKEEVAEVLIRLGKSVPTFSTRVLDELSS